jgi:hypothetical protein
MTPSCAEAPSVVEVVARDEGLLDRCREPRVGVITGGNEAMSTIDALRTE